MGGELRDLGVGGGGTHGEGAQMRPQWHTPRGKPNYSPEAFAEFSGLPPQHKLLT
jgi:hypothetical protein